MTNEVSFWGGHLNPYTPEIQSTLDQSTIILLIEHAWLYQ
jgi:hypothetical protein